MRGRVTGSSHLTISVQGISGIRRALRPLLEPEITAELDASTKRAAQLYARELRTELRPISRHMSRAVRVKRAKTGKPDWVVGSRRKVAYFWHMVIGGTRDHGPRKAPALMFVPNWNPYIGASSRGIETGRVVRARRVRGVPANPAVERVATRNERRAFSLAEQQFLRSTGL